MVYNTFDNVNVINNVLNGDRNRSNPQLLLLKIIIGMYCICSRVTQSSDIVTFDLPLSGGARALVN